ncbi:hypothetical protein [Desulfurivibrio sp. C05AmB]|uniref:hypothetical protein n=1 Tax=Desulfurivibrio sp. C05AmB TaxID=3374371 RepID=UPI00376EC831
MWFFGIKKKARRSTDSDSTPGLEQIITRDGIDKLHENTGQLRVWLPTRCKQALDDVVELHGLTGACYLREFLTVYLYGEHELLRMRREKTGLYYQPQSEGSRPVMYSRSPATDVVPGMGKNIVPIKLFLPEKIKNDLKELAGKTDIALSTFVRELLISHLLGHTLWPERLRNWAPEEEERGINWESCKLDAKEVRIVDGKRVDG